MSKSLSDWLHELENRHTQEIQLGLSRIRSAALRLNLLHQSATVITVAGTNGKGSTVAALESIYVHAGYQTGAYTSPHLLRFNERIKVNQQPISDDMLICAFEIIDNRCSDIKLTYFEMVTLAGLWFFKNQKPDVIILEVGLGGRLDATNCIDNDLAIITTIDFDHQAILGNTREEIGFEKAGILREDKPFIFADTSIPDSVLNQAKILRSSLYRNGIEYSWTLNKDQFNLTTGTKVFNLPVTSLHGNSIAAAVMAVHLLHDKLPVTPHALTTGLANTTLPGRLQTVKTDSHTIIFDVAHNPQSVSYLAAYLKKQKYHHIHAVFSALSDKDLRGMLTPMRDIVSFWYPALLESKRALTAQQLVEALDDITVQVCHNSPLVAFENACQQADTNDLIIVFGSFITVAAVMTRLFNVT